MLAKGENRPKPKRRWLRKKFVFPQNKFIILEVALEYSAEQTFGKMERKLICL